MSLKPEAIVCALQVVLTPHTGAHDFVQSGVNDEIVPIRSPAATTKAVLKRWERVREQRPLEVERLREQLSFTTFSNGFLGQLETLGLITNHVLIAPSAASPAK